jgi:hypothetical protein
LYHNGSEALPGRGFTICDCGSAIVEELCILFTQVSSVWEVIATECDSAQSAIGEYYSPFSPENNLPLPEPRRANVRWREARYPDRLD